LRENSGTKRNTPTYVGKTDTRYLQAQAVEKHPHVRGENAQRDGFRNADIETPPRTWGKHQDIV
jgi:hypothetical protein